MSIDFKEQVRDRTDLVALIGRTVKLPRTTGRLIMAPCPFHADKGPSLAIYVDQQRWHCYGGCQEGGDAFAWIMKRDNVDFVEAVKVLAREAGLELPQRRERTPAEKAAKSEREQALIMLAAATSFYHERLLDDKAGAAHRAYLEKRGFRRETWEHWLLGAAGGGNELLAFLRKQGLDLQLAMKLGLIGAYERGGQPFNADRFKNRVIIPFIEPGAIVYMTGRRIDDKKEAKYLHLNSSELLPKPPYNAKGRGDDLLLVEGPLDVWAAEALASELSLVPVALMGLHEGDYDFAKLAKRHKRVLVGLDSDGTVRGEVLDKVVQHVGTGAQVVVWPGGDDAAAWLASGATTEQFANLLNNSKSYLDYFLERVKTAPTKAKAGLIDQYVGLLSALPQIEADLRLKDLKTAAGGSVRSNTLNKALNDARKGRQAGRETTGSASSTQGGAQGRGADGGSDSPKGSDRSPREWQYYRVHEGNLVCGKEDELPKSITEGGYPQIERMVTVDDGEARTLQLDVAVHLKDGRVFKARVPAKDSADPGKVMGLLREVAGPRLTFTANKAHLLQAMDVISAEGLSEVQEIAHTGWVTSEAGELAAFVTPGGVIGELPPNTSVGLPESLGRYNIHDSGDELFAKGMAGLKALMAAHVPELMMPMLAFALLPPAARFLPTAQKFMLHVSGETGAQKTTTASVLMGLYGDFSNQPSVASWRSTTNSIEVIGSYLPDVLGMVDDYKPRIVKLWDFVDLIQRYADNNDRTRLARDISLRTRRPARWWMLSTGEDVPAGESSTLARMVVLRFKRRPAGEGYNKWLGKAQELAEGFPTVMARWVAFLQEKNATLPAYWKKRWPTVLADLSKQASAEVEGVPNMARIASNLAMLSLTWNLWLAFIAERVAEGHKFWRQALPDMDKVLVALAAEQAAVVKDEKPTRVFFEALQAGLDSGRFRCVKKGADATHSGPDNFVGYYDDNSFYLLPAAYLQVSKYKREGGEQLGFSERELWRLIKEEGLLATKSSGSSTIPMQFGTPGNRVNKRVIHLVKDVIHPPDQAESEDTE